jgi:5-methyltetrahydrofolate corrinoid/iron sulfur protein methyltransferase
LFLGDCTEDLKTMYIIGELINGMYRNVAKAIKEKDKIYIKALTRAQVEAGVDALDVNCGPASDNAVSDMRWLVETVQEEASLPLSLDHTRYEAIEEGLKIAKSRAIINSTSADEERLTRYISLAKKYHASLIVLTMDKKGVPQDKDHRLELAAHILDIAGKNGFAINDLYLDPMLMPINTAQNQLFDILEALKDFKLLAKPSPKTILGLSNISQGAKDRQIINRTFLAMALACGLDAAILDPLDQELMNSLVTADLILNKKIYCDSYLEAYKKDRKTEKQKTGEF